ncbi:MAG: alpha/beta hydrolase domain-containing protein [Chloroflexi bacterium]|nr:alpha/beta hydrolase domain-containing protein [Chloroflexota bacterium]
MAVTSIDIKERVPYAVGMTFGDTGAYERLDGTVHFAVDPSNSANSLITDLELAPKNPAGLVEFSADFKILKPIDQHKGNHKLLFDVVNRGKPLSLMRINSAPETDPMDPGNGFLMRRGYTQVWCGWQHDVPETPGLLGIDVPEALGVSGRIAVTFQPNEAATTQMLSDRGHLPYPASNLEQIDAELSVCDYDAGPATVLTRSDWSFGRLDQSGVVPDVNHINMASGFQPGKVYRCIYTTAKAPVAGLGIAAVRDLISNLRYSTSQDNPCAGDIQHTMAFGSSQSGRFLRHMLYLAMNQDEDDRMVFDGIIAHIAGGRRGEFNQRFGQPSNLLASSTGSLFPFADTEQTDPETGQADGLLSRLAARGKLPKLFLTNTSSEYWSGHAALTHVDATGSKDLTPSENVRIYHFSGTQHNAGVLPLKHTQPTGASGLHPFNWVDWRPLMRGALANLDAWVSQGVAPAPSKHPRLDDGTAVLSESLRPAFRAIRQTGFPEQLRHMLRLDFGPNEGITENLPPVTGKPYPALVSNVDQDGNELGGIRLPDVAVPLATVMGWNLRHPDTGGVGQTHKTMGPTVPFAFTQQEREESSDPRLSIEERYASRDVYLEKVKIAAGELVSQGYLLEEDIQTVAQQAGERYYLVESLAKQPQPAGD